MEETFGPDHPDWDWKIAQFASWHRLGDHDGEFDRYIQANAKEHMKKRYAETDWIEL